MTPYLLTNGTLELNLRHIVSGARHTEEFAKADQQLKHFDCRKQAVASVAATVLIVVLGIILGLTINTFSAAIASAAIIPITILSIYAIKYQLLKKSYTETNKNLSQVFITMTSELNDYRISLLGYVQTQYNATSKQSKEEGIQLLKNLKSEYGTKNQNYLIISNLATQILLFNNLPQNFIDACTSLTQAIDYTKVTDNFQKVSFFKKTK